MKLENTSSNQPLSSLTEKHLLDAGYPAGPMIPLMISAAETYQNRGISGKKYLLKLIARDFGAPQPALVMRETPLPLAEAICATDAEEKENLALVRKQMQQLLRVPVIQHGSVMPDACPTGKAPASMPVGGVVVAHRAIIPSAHSSDICCSMFATFYEARTTVTAELDALTSSTRFGPSHRNLDDLVHHPVLEENVWLNPFLHGLKDRAHAHLADQGDGNHFAYLGEITVTTELLVALQQAGYHDLHAALAVHPIGKILRALVTHHGSRGLGAHVFKRGQIAAEKHTAKAGCHIPDAAAWLDADSLEGRDYWDALQYISRWTRANHECIHRRFLERIMADGLAQIGNEHNFVWKRGEDFYHGKGATPAWNDDNGRPLLGLIPLNMAEPILLVLGLNNEEYLSFAPHGAGRNLSRTAMRRHYPTEEAKAQVIEQSTRGLDIRWYCGKPDISETPVAYKNAATIRRQIERFKLAEVIAEIRPLGCIMAGDSGRSWREREEELTPKQKRQIEHRADRRKVRQALQDQAFDDENERPH